MQVRDIVELAGLILTLGGMVWHLGGRLAKIDTKLEAVESWINEQRDMAISLPSAKKRRR